MRIAIVGGGIAGAMLAWRLHTEHRLVPDVFVGARPGTPDATGASGGLVRGYETDPTVSRAAVEGLIELRDDPRLREWADYRDVGSTYLLAPGSDPGPSVGVVEDLLPGSIAVGPAPAAFRGVAAGTVAMTERHAGHLSPAALRAAVLTHLAGAGIPVRVRRVAAIAPGEVRLADGTRHGYDTVVAAAGAWTPGLLTASGLPATDWRTKQIQFSVYARRAAGPGTFVDTASGLYGRPMDDGLLLGLHCDRWDVDPDATTPDLELAARVGVVAREVFGADLGAPVRTVAAFDCYHEAPGLTLRSLVPGLLTFTGGSGGAAKTVLSASRTAARALLAPAPYPAPQEV
ncbi:FAD-dependent oxidoreductase [Longispora urticae]